MPQAKKPKLKKWEGALGRPVERWPKDVLKTQFPNLTSEELDSLIAEEVELERRRKLVLLLEHYGVAGKSGRDFMELSKRLAVDFVNGFKLAEFASKPVGAPGRWTTAAGAQLVEEVDALKEAGRLTAADAIRLIRELDPKRYGKMNERSLRKRYDEARKRFGR
jgi:hypothetical protein